MPGSGEGAALTLCGRGLAPQTGKFLVPESPRGKL